eukprot:4715554-Prymnesium_polylepis.3
MQGGARRRRRGRQGLEQQGAERKCSRHRSARHDAGGVGGRPRPGRAGGDHGLVPPRPAQVERGPHAPRVAFPSRRARQARVRRERAAGGAAVAGGVPLRRAVRRAAKNVRVHVGDCG